MDLADVLSVDLSPAGKKLDLFSALLFLFMLCLVLVTSLTVGLCKHYWTSAVEVVSMLVGT